jgi:uncharacterized membrane protein YeiH
MASPGGRLAVVLAGVDAAAVLLFAVEGGALAAAAHLDLLGVLVVAVATALGGGVIRDLLLGDAPPAAVRDARFAVIAIVGGVAVFLFYRYVREIPDPVLITLDAGGLALFAVSGTAKALEFRLGGLMCVFMGGVTAVGGGVIRDLLLTRVPVILRLDVYATAALVGAAVMVIGVRRGAPRNVMMIAGAVVCFGLRLLGAWRHWNLPTAVGV